MKRDERLDALRRQPKAASRPRPQECGSELFKAILAAEIVYALDPRAQQVGSQN